MNKALVIGSISYDRIFNIDGCVEDGIVIEDGKIKDFDLTFRADEPSIHFGGTGGNIAYGIGTMGANTILSGIVGNDFHNGYEGRLHKLGIQTFVHTKETSLTATFYGIDDKNHKTISIWQPNAANYIEELILTSAIPKESYKDIVIGIVSAPGRPEGIPNLLKQSRSLLGQSVPLIFDPGQDLSFMTNQSIIESLKIANIVIVNDIEINQLKKGSNLELNEILGMGIKMIIVTEGEKGATAYLPDGTKIHVNACTPSKIVQVTGAGDAFRAGFIYGILGDMEIETSLQYGAVMGSFAVEAIGGQGYKVNNNDIKERFNLNYK